MIIKKEDCCVDESAREFVVVGEGHSSLELSSRDAVNSLSS